MGYSMGEAARTVGRSKATLSRAIASGRLSATKLEGGGYSIEPVELARVFPPETVSEPSPWKVTKQNDTVSQPTEVAGEPHETGSVELAELRVRVEMLGAQLVQQHQASDDLRDALRKAEERADRFEERLHRLLLERSAAVATVPAAAPAQAAPSAPPAPRLGFLARFVLGR